ncbi:MAG: hypothetical protein QM655_11255 [Nocardioidaceae bacterium]
MPKQRITVTVDTDLAEEARRAATSAGSASLSAWVAKAIAGGVEQQHRIAAMAGAVEAYEAEHGVFTEKELADQRKADAADAIRVRGGKVVPPVSGVA